MEIWNLKFDLEHGNEEDKFYEQFNGILGIWKP